MRYIQGKREQEKPVPADIIGQKLSTNIEANRQALALLLTGCSDAVMKDFYFGHDADLRGLVVYFDGLTDRNEVENNLLRPLLLEINMVNREIWKPEGLDNFSLIAERIVSLADLKMVDSLEEVIHHMCSGDAVFIFEGSARGLAAGTRSWQGRTVQTPENELVIFGPKEGFVETLRFNTALVRRRLKSSQLKIENLVLGRISKTDVAFMYIEGIAPPGLVEEVRQRLNRIDIDAVLDVNYLEEFIMDEKATIFTQAEHSEKPDRVCAHMLEGRVCLLVDGSPMALIVPVSFPQFWISPEDYYVHYVPASLFRLLRFISFWLALTLPSLYVATISYHHEMIPTDLFLTIAATRQGVPFPAFVEALLLEFTFEMLREAGLRLPRAVGPAVSIVGALIIGDAAVRAGLVSTPMVVVIAATGIASFVAPAYNAAIIIRIARFGFLVAAAALGFLGIMIAFILMLVRMASMSSFGMPYLTPVAPFNRSQLSDIFLRRPWFKMEKRPFVDGMSNVARQNPDDKGEPPS